MIISDYTTEELKNAIKIIIDEIKFLNLENDVFEQYLKRTAPGKNAIILLILKSVNECTLKT